MGCGSSVPASRVTPAPNVPRPVPQIESTSYTQAAPATDDPFAQGAKVLLDGQQWRIQYVNFRGLLDLRAADGDDVRYG
eukprot:701295-Prymnesium_polylepis.1